MPKPTEVALVVFELLPPEHQEAIANLHKRTLNRPPVQIEDFTCADCPHVKTCVYSFDLYNLDGDCLAEK